MTSLIILAAIAAATIGGALFFRVNSILLFTSVAVGDLLVRYMGEDATLVVSSAYRGNHDEVIAKLGLLVLPLILTLFFGRHSFSKAKVVLHFIPIVATGIVLSLLVLGLLPGGFQHDVYSWKYGYIIQQNQDLAIAAAGVASLIVAWITNGTGKSKHSKKH